MAKATVPFLVKHVALAIYESGDVHGSSKVQKITGAMDIARHRLVEYGFLRRGSEKGAVDQIHLTPKGLERERKHKFHGPAAKNKKFDLLYGLISAVDEEGSTSPSENEDNEANSEDQVTPRRRRVQPRHARVAQ